jgi:hypothetical protein
MRDMNVPTFDYFISEYTYKQQEVPTSTGCVGSNLSRASHCFREQETLHSLFHTGWFQERFVSVSISL